MPETEGWLTRAEAAAFLGVTPKTIDRLAGRKAISKAFRRRPGLPPVAVFRPDDLAKVKQEKHARTAVTLTAPSVQAKAPPEKHEVYIQPHPDGTCDFVYDKQRYQNLDQNEVAKQIVALFKEGHWNSIFSADTAQQIAAAASIIKTTPEAPGVFLRLTAITEPGPPTITKQLTLADAFTNGFAKIPCNPAVRAHIEALNKAGRNAQRLGWKENTKGAPVYLHTSSDDEGQILVYSDLKDASPTEKWEQVRSLGALTLDVFLSVLAQVHEDLGQDSVVLNAVTILRNKGIRRRGKERRRLEQRIDTEIRNLASLRFDAGWPVTYVTKDGRRKHGIQKWTDDRLFDIVRSEFWQPSLIGDQAILVAVQWHVRFGQSWRQFWLTEDTHWIAYCARTLLELDHRDQRGVDVIAKKIGIYLTTLPGASLGNPREILIETLLDRIGELPANPDKYWGGRTRDLVQDALQRLVTIGFLQWEPIGVYNEENRRKGWIRRWLKCKLRFSVLRNQPKKQITA